MTKKENGFETLARLIKHESEEIRAELGGELARLNYRMDSGFARIDQDLSSVRSEIGSVRTDVAELQQYVKKHEDYAREIDHILQRTVRIETHLGLKHEISED